MDSWTGTSGTKAGTLSAAIKEVEAVSGLRALYLGRTRVVPLFATGELQQSLASAS